MGIGIGYAFNRFIVLVKCNDLLINVLFLVMFSDERRLVSPETRSEQARRIFKSFDPDGNNFISSALLQDVLQALDLVSDEG